ncbi:MAG: T9SS type A sorting domain-containing protein [Bacteroidales bacterium]
MKLIKYFLLQVFSIFILFTFIFLFESSEKKTLPVELKPNDWFFNQRAYPAGKINYEIFYKEVETLQKTKKELKDSSYWEFAGPINTGGRLSDVEVHSENPEILWIGAASGGIFKSTNGGNQWHSVFDNALSLSIGDIAIASSNPDILYAGTGEANAGGGSQTYEGAGIYKSMDGGETWEYTGLPDSRNIGRIAIHPENPDIVYVAAMGNLFADSPDRGIYKSTDGGLNWDQSLFVSDSTGGIDLVIDPQSPEIIYAAMWERVRRPNRRSYGGATCGIFKSTDGGGSWVELVNGLPSPGNNVGRIGISISNSDPNILYAIYADKTGYFDGVYKTVNGGELWIQTNDDDLEYSYQSYGWWFGRIKVDPVNPDIAYVIGFDLYKTTNGGNSWTNISYISVHVDQHEIYIYPENNNLLFLSNDGGFYTSTNGGNSWTWINNLPITQFYTCEIDEQYPVRLYGGTQDNGTNRTMTGVVDNWQFIYGGDGFYVLVNPEDNNFIFAEYQYGNLARSVNGGNSFSSSMNGINSSDRMNWMTPVVFDPTDPSILYYGSHRMYKSTTNGSSWNAISTDLTNGPGINLTYGTITTISVSPVNPEIIYVGTDDGNVWVSATNGMGWEYLGAELPERWVTRVVADPVEENTVYVTFSGYRWDEFLPHVFRSEDKGATWEDISSNLPEVPVNDLIADPEDNAILYLATDIGVFVSYSLGQSWELLGANLPNVPVNDLDLHNPTRKLVAATFGRSMYTYDLFQDTLSTFINPGKGIPEASIRISPNPWTDILAIEIQCTDESYGNIQLYTLSGRLLQTIPIDFLSRGNNFLRFNTYHFPALKNGTYIFNVEINGKDTGKKIVFKGAN